jgi:hypothetical protein
LLIYIYYKSQARGNGDENGEEHDQLQDDGDDDIPAAKDLKVGDSLPTVTLKNEKDEDVNVAELTADKGLVLFLVPKADTRQSLLSFCTARFSASLVAFFYSNKWCCSWLHETSLWLPRLIS